MELKHDASKLRIEHFVCMSLLIHSKPIYPEDRKGCEYSKNLGMNSYHQQAVFFLISSLLSEHKPSQFIHSAKCITAIVMTMYVKNVYVEMHVYEEHWTYSSK